MNRTGLQWIVLAVAVLAVAALVVVLGLNLVPSRAELLEKGSAAPWFVIWIMIWATVLCAVALAQFLLKAGMGKHAN